jgi:hypothetical protein
LKNDRALPRAWLVGQAQAVDGETALHMIRGEGNASFDPRETVLLEVRPDELPQLAGGKIAQDSSATLIEYQPTHLSIETNASTNSVLVISEIFYPGWKATIDGQPARIMLADFLLRAISLPPGNHKIEMHYTPTAAYTGAAISVAALALLALIAFYERRTQQRAHKSNS